MERRGLFDSQPWGHHPVRLGSWPRHASHGKVRVFAGVPGAEPGVPAPVASVGMPARLLVAEGRSPATPSRPRSTGWDRHEGRR